MLLWDDASVAEEEALSDGTGPSMATGLVSIFAKQLGVDQLWMRECRVVNNGTGDSGDTKPQGTMESDSKWLYISRSHERGIDDRCKSTICSDR